MWYAVVVHAWEIEVAQAHSAAQVHSANEQTVSNSDAVEKAARALSNDTQPTMTEPRLGSI